MNFSFGAKDDDPPSPPGSKIPPNYPTDFAEFESMLYENSLKLEKSEIALTTTKRALKDEKLKTRELKNMNDILRQTIDKFNTPTPYNSLKVSFNDYVVSFSKNNIFLFVARWVPLLEDFPSSYWTRCNFVVSSYYLEPERPVDFRHNRI